MDIKKEQQRQAGIAARKAIPRDIAMQKGVAISKRLLAFPIYKQANTIFTYSPFGAEADISFFNEEAIRDEKRLAYPICYGKGLMKAAVPNNKDGWETGKYGIHAPIENRSHILDPYEIDLIIVPCTAFDGQSRMRIGMGAGFYDRYLPQCINALTIAVAYEAQHIKDIHCDEWDVALDAIVTENHLY